MAQRFGQGLACLGIPDANGIVFGPGEKTTPVRAESDDRDHASVF
jgi:hypothetical protein